MKAVTNVCPTTMLMNIKKISKSGLTHPFGDHRTVTQAFPAGIPTKESDPFLMCDYFDMTDPKGKPDHEDEFPVDWHPHRGFDIASYLRSGIGRHGDSLGNREIFTTPGMQWMSTGSGVEHAEGGFNEKGTEVQGFQIWVNVPAERKMDDPRYGTVPTSDLPLLGLVSSSEPGDGEGGSTARARVLAGDAFGVKGPFETVQPVQMIDFEFDKSSPKFDLSIGKGLDTAMLYVYEGVLESVNGDGPFEAGQILLFDAEDGNEKRGVSIVAADDFAGKAMLFAGKKLKEPVAWHGPIVMNTQQQIRETIHEIQTGEFPPKRVSWDYKRLSSKPETSSS